MNSDNRLPISRLKDLVILTHRGMVYIEVEQTVNDLLAPFVWIINQIVIHNPLIDRFV